jgi:hypothetical protein
MPMVISAHFSALSLLQDGVAETIERAVAAIPEENPARRAFLAAYDEVLGQLEPLAFLHSEAHLLMQGDRAAARRFEILLARIAEDFDEGSFPDTDENTVEFDTSSPPEDHFVRLDKLLLVALATGSLQIEPQRFAATKAGLFALLNTLTELQEIYEAARAFLGNGNPAPMQTLAWRSPKPKPRGGRPKIKTKPKRPARKPIKVKIKDTHHAFVSCFKNGLARAGAEAQLAPRFTVSSVSPIDACPGELVTILGTNFGTLGGTVGFKAAFGSDPDYIAVNPLSWADTVILVIVPAEAREGPLRIHALDHTFETCFRRFQVYRLPDKFGPQNDAFEGGLPDIFSVQADGKDKGAWAGPGATVTISWVTTKGDVSLDIRNDANPADPHWSRSSLVGGVGSTPWVTEAVVSPTKFVISLTVKNRCGPYSKDIPVMVTIPATLTIDGVEVTQGIQTYSTTGGPRNTVPTVEGKDTIVRVYAKADRGGWFFDSLPNMTASLSIDGTIFAPINGASPGAMSGGSPFRGIGSGISREPAGNSFNFRIPAAFAVGTKTIHVGVFGSDELGFQTKSQNIPWTWHHKLAVRVRYIRVSYQGVLTSAYDAEDTAYRAFDVIPSPPTDIGPAWMATSQFADGVSRYLD